MTIVALLSRTDYCKLVGLEVEQLNALRRRDQMPSVPNLDLAEEVANERGYAHAGLATAKTAPKCER